MHQAVALILALVLAFAGGTATLLADEQPSKLGGERDPDGQAITDIEGNERATVTVIDAADPFENTAEGFVPTEGAHPVMLTVRIENTGDLPFEIRPDQFQAQDDQGYLWRPTSIPRTPEEVVIPDLAYVTLAPGDRLTGMVGYEVPDDRQVAALLLNPEWSRYLTIASISDPVSGPVDLGEPVSFTVPDTGAEAEVVIAELVDPFEDFPEGRDPEPDTRYVQISLTVENVGSVPVDLGPSAFVLLDSAGFLHTWGFVPREPDATIPELSSQALAPGSRVSGVVGFVLPDDVEIAAVVLQPESSRMIPLYVLEP
jgi:hypothetical protein